MSRYRGRPMDPAQFEMKDLKRRQATAERHIERLKGQVRSLQNALDRHVRAYYNSDEKPHWPPEVSKKEDPK